MPIPDGLRPASFRGVPFGVLAAESQFGRKGASHDYPFRDDPWAEDMGRRVREKRIQGFLLAGSRVYQGGDVIAQRDRLVAAVETPGPALLVHPSFGDLTVALPLLALTERLDAGTYFEFSLTVTEAGRQLYPKAEDDTGAQVDAKAAAAQSASKASFLARAGDALKRGAAVVDQAVASVGQYTARAVGVAADATNLLGMVSRLPGTYGRYFNGANLGAYGLLANPAAAGSTLSGLIAQGAALRGKVGAAASALSAAARGGDAAGMASGVLAASAAVRASAQDPSDGLRLLGRLAEPLPHLVTTGSAVGLAMGQMRDAAGDLFRRSAVIDMSLAATAYQPRSYDDAAAVRSRVADALDAEIVIAGDRGEDDVFAALRDLRLATVRDLTARGANLAPLRDWTAPSNLPSLVLAQRFYADPSRADELVAAGDPIHPLFAPTRIRALAE